MEIMKKDNLKPHIEVAETGIVPEGKQRGLLLLYLEGKGIEPIQGATTYGCINKILKMDNLKVFDKKIVKKKILVKKIYLPITAENIEEQHRLVEESANYFKRKFFNILFSNKTTWKSVGWAIFHGLLSWACIRNWQQRKTSIDFYGKLRLLMVK